MRRSAPVSLKKMSLKQLQVAIGQGGAELYREVIRLLAEDPRGGAQKLVRYCRARLDEEQRERERLNRMYGYERQVWAMGYRRVAGLDEAGRGPLAGPVVAAAVILPGEVHLPGLDDSKRLTPRRREELAAEIRTAAVAVGVGMVHPRGIDESNVLMATYRAMALAVADLAVAPDYLLVDALHLPGVTQPQSPIVGGDGLSCSIAAASIIAKVTRDAHMVEMDRQYPEYGFANHKGYGTAEHRAALEKHGPCPIHRRSFAPVREIARLTPGLPLTDEGR